MLKFKTFKELRKHVDKYELYTQYLEDELNNFLACIGSNNGYFTVEIEGKKYDLTVNATCINEDEELWEYEYVILEEY